MLLVDFHLNQFWDDPAVRCLQVVFQSFLVQTVGDRPSAYKAQISDVRGEGSSVAWLYGPIRANPGGKSCAFRGDFDCTVFNRDSIEWLSKRVVLGGRLAKAQIGLEQARSPNLFRLAFSDARQVCPFAARTDAYIHSKKVSFLLAQGWPKLEGAAGSMCGEGDGNLFRRQRACAARPLHC